MAWMIGADNLEARDLLVAKSTVNLRAEPWLWVSDIRRADLWLVDLSRSLERTPHEMLGHSSLCRLAEAPPATGWAARCLARPLKASHLMRYLDALLAELGPARRQPVEAPPAPVEVAPALAVGRPPAAAAGDGEPALPWRGKQLRLLRQPNLARFPVSVELMGWLEAMADAPVSFERLDRLLPLDRDMLRDVLNHAARRGELVDEAGSVLPAIDEPRSRLAFWRR